MLDPVPMTLVVPRYRCGAVPDSHRVPSCDDQSEDRPNRRGSILTPPDGGGRYAQLLTRCGRVPTLLGSVAEAGSRWKSGAVLATVTGEPKPLVSHWISSDLGRPGRVSIRESGDRLHRDEWPIHERWSRHDT
jgi:hypothetical protein